MTQQHIDRKWFEETLLGETNHWLTAARTPSGFLQTALDRQWRPMGKQYGTLVSQSRLLFVFAIGYERTGRDEYLDAVRNAADFLLAHFYDTTNGGWFWQVSPAGLVEDTTKGSYGHVFVMFGLTHAYRVTKDQRYLRAALATWEVMKAKFRDSQGGYKQQTNADFSQDAGVRSQNPMMHLFESLLALSDATGLPTIRQEAFALAEFLFTRLYQCDKGYLPEVYDQAWKPMPADRNGHVDVGHQFEWAFLLSDGVNHGLSAGYLDIARRLLEFGVRAGYDKSQGGIWSRASYDGKPLDTQRKGWWQQCELLRALMHHAATRGREDLWPLFDQSLAYVKEHFIDPQYGGWYENHFCCEPRPADQWYKGTVWQVGYHVIGMYGEALRLAK